MSLRSPKAHGHVTRAILWKFIGKNAVHGFRGRHSISKFTRKNAHGHVAKATLCENSEEKCRTHPVPPRSNTGPFTVTVRTPQCGHTVWGNM